MEKVKSGFKLFKVALIGFILLFAVLFGYSVLQPVLHPNVSPTGAITLNYQIENSLDDADQVGVTWTTTATSVRCYSNTAPASRIYAGILFRPVAIPQGATLLSANLSLYSYSTATDDPNLDIYGHDVDNAPTFGSGEDIINRVRTTATVAWSQVGVGTGWKAKDVTAIVQEIVSRTNWVSGSNMSFLWICRINANYGFSFRSKDYTTDPTLRAKLDVSFIAPPQASSVASSTNIIGRKTVFSAFWTGSSLSGYIFSWNQTGSWVNGTWTDPWSGTPDTGWSNVTKELTTIPNVKYGYRFYVNDTIGWGDTGIKTLTTQILDYSTTKTLSVGYTDTDTTDPNTWILVASNLEFKQSAAGWIGKSFTANREWGNWVYLSDIDGDGPVYQRHCEIQVYDYDSATWVTPSAIYNYSTQNPSYPVTNFIDASTSTEWWTTKSNDQYITLTLTTIRQISRIQIYHGTSSQSNITVGKVYIGKKAGWDFVGSAPWVATGDYPTNYVWTDKPNRPIEFTLSDTSGTSTVVGNLTLSVLVSGNDYVSNFFISYYNPPTYPYTASYWSNTSSQSTTTSWSTINFTLTRLFWRKQHLDDLKIRIYSGSSVTKISVDKVWITYKAMNQENMINWLWDNIIYSRMINDTLPLVRNYDEYTQKYTFAGNELLSGVTYYALTGNQTFLDYAGKYVRWLNGTSIDKLWRQFNNTDQTWTGAPYTIGSAGAMQALAMYVARNQSFMPLLQKAINNYTAMFFPNDGNKRPYNSVYLNGSPYGQPNSYDYNHFWADSYAGTVNALAYVAAVANDESLMLRATDMAMLYTLSNYYIPYHGIWRNGTKDTGFDFSKQYSAGYQMLALNTVYFWTGNQTIRNRLQSMTENCAVAFWNATWKRYVYRVNSADNPPPPLGTGTQWQIAEKTMGWLHEGLLYGYMLFENQTWLNRIKQSWDTYMTTTPGYGSLTNDLITHQGAQSFESDESYTAIAKRISIIFYDLNKTGFYRNQTYLDNFNMLYGAVTSKSHFSTLGWRVIANASDFGWWYSAGAGQPPTGTTLLGVGQISRNFQNVTTVTINNYDNYWNNFGDPFTGEVPPALMYTGLGTNTTKRGKPIQFYVEWRVPQSRDLSKWRFSSNNTGTWTNSSWTSTWSGTLKKAYARYNTTLNSTADRVEYRFYANDTIDTVSVTSLGYVMTRTYLALGWNNITAWMIDVGHALGEINASIWNDSIQFTVLSKWNGTYYTFRRGYTWYSTVKVLAKTDRLLIYVTVAGEWEHNY